MDADRKHKFPRGTENILVVDDEPSILRLSRRVLQSLGYTVVGVPTPEAAIGRFAAAPDYFDLVITDMSTLEVSDGRLNSVISRIRPEIPFLLHTGGISKDYEKGVIHRVLQKPATLTEIACAVRGTLDTAAYKGQIPPEPSNPSGICFGALP